MGLFSAPATPFETILQLSTTPRTLMMFSKTRCCLPPRTSRVERVASLGYQKEASPSAPHKFEFPHLAPAARAMMDELLRIVEHELGGDLLPTETDPNVQNFQTPQGNSRGSVVLRAGKNRDFVRNLTWNFHPSLVASRVRESGTKLCPKLATKHGGLCGAPLEVMATAPVSQYLQIMAVLHSLCQCECCLCLCV